MFTYLFVYFCLCSASAFTTQNSKKTKEWAVLVAGSNGFDNYRHQANVAHAYHLLLDHGLPASQIITFAYDDIAYDQRNPFPGKIFNDYSHKDYYKGLVIDYKGADVTPEMLVKVLKSDSGLKKKGLKVLQSGPNDDVFLYFTDHGATGIFGFPDGFLTASDLNKTITFMYKHKFYQKLVIYLEACESGSMLKDILSPKINAFAISSADEEQATYAVFCDDPQIDACLSDEFSSNWMIDSDASIGKMTLSKFQGDKNVRPALTDSKLTGAKDYVPARQAHIHRMMKTVMRAKSSKEQEIAQRGLNRAIKLGELAKETMSLVADTVNLKASQDTHQSVDTSDVLTCVEQAYKSFEHNCFSFQRVPEVAKEIHKLKKLCQRGVKSSHIIAAIEQTCP